MALPVLQIDLPRINDRWALLLALTLVLRQYVSVFLVIFTVFSTMQQFRPLSHLLPLTPSFRMILLMPSFETQPYLFLTEGAHLLSIDQSHIFNKQQRTDKLVQLYESLVRGNYRCISPEYNKPFSPNLFILTRMLGIYI